MSYLDQVLNSTERLKSKRNSKVMDLVSGIQAKRRAAAPVGEPSQAVINAAKRATGSAPKGGTSGGSVDDWIRQALSKTGLDESYLPGIKNMIMRESSGNPNAINNWDSNAKKGTPSKGLMQTIDPTFQRWALPGYDQNVYDPVSNIIAGIRYAQNRYGNDMLRAGGRKNAQGKYIGY